MMHSDMGGFSMVPNLGLLNHGESSNVCFSCDLEQVCVGVCLLCVCVCVCVCVLLLSLKGRVVGDARPGEDRK